MLQVDPVKRISVEELKVHPWVVKDVCIPAGFFASSTEVHISTFFFFINLKIGTEHYKYGECLMFENYCNIFYRICFF